MKNKKINSNCVNGCKKIVGAVSHRIDRVLMKSLRVLPIKQNCLVLQSSGDYWDNARVFYDYLIDIEFNKDHEIIWLVNDPREYNKSVPRNVKFVRFESWFPCVLRDYYMAVTRCFIYTHGGWLNNWRKNQVFIHTTHSASQLKAAGRPTASDYALACGSDGVERKIISLQKTEDRLPILGMPRLDLLYRHRDCVSQLFPDQSECKLILSMETFKQGKKMKDSTSNDQYAINVIQSIDELVELDEYLKKNNTIFVVKIHHLQNLSFLKRTSLRNIHFLTDDDLKRKNVQLYELIENADILLTDYSSVFYDFLLLDRPIGFMIGDIQEYKRGFIIENPLDEMVGEKLHTKEDLEIFIENTLNGIDHYKTKRRELCDRVFSFQDDNNCKRLLDWLYEKKVF